MRRSLAAVVPAILIAACATSPAPRHAAAPAAALLTSMPVPGAYRIDPAQSELRVLVYRAGSLASFGHNHVLINRELSGTVTVGASLESTAFTLSLPVDSFRVDETEARLQEGEDFPGEISASAKEGTLHNLLSPALLDGAGHPTIQIRSEQLMETNGELNAIMAVTVAGREASIEAPFVLTPAGQGVGAEASFEVRQTELGLTPMSLMGGALQVRDAVRIRLRLLALSP